jgi:exosortase/archaeosortase family protein
LTQRNKDNPRDDAAAGGLGPRAEGAPRTWWATHGRDIRFLVIFALLMGIYFAVSTTSAMNDRFFPWYLQKTAAVSGWIVDVLGFDGLEVRDKTLFSRRGTITVERGCDAIAPTALFLSAVMASPAAWSLKLVGLFGGFVVLMIVNVLRIITLFWTRVFWIAAFDVMHLDIWQFLFILLAIMLWALWASWASKQAKRWADVRA